MPTRNVEAKSGTAGLLDLPNARGIRYDTDDDLLKFLDDDGSTVRSTVTTDQTQTLTNKTLTSPTITGATMTTESTTSPTIVTSAVLSAATNDLTIAWIDQAVGAGTLRFPDIGGVSSGVPVGATITYTEDASSTTHTGTVEIPANATILDIVCSMGVLWNPTGACVFDVGDDDDPDGWFDNVNMKATDWLVGEVLSAMDDGTWGGVNGVYLTAAGRRGQAVAAYAGPHTTAATEVIGVATVTTPNATAGRTYMTVTYVAPTAVAATTA